MYQYRNTSDRDRVLINIGVVKAGETVTVNHPINNRNFERVQVQAEQAPEAPAPQPSVVGTEPVQPQAVTEVHQIPVNEAQGE